MKKQKKQAFSAEMPYDLMYQASRKEASRKKPVFFIHKYFARRITANYRMALLGFIANKYDSIFEKFYSNSANNSQDSNLTILDPFMGGGTIIFEALRFGCNVIGNDLQPLSLFVTKALVEPVNEKAVTNTLKKMESSVGQKIKHYYHTQCPECGKTADLMYAFHVKKAKTNTICKEHRFFSSFVIAYKKGEFTIVCPVCGKLHKTKFENGAFECECGWKIHSPKDSYIKRGVFRCPYCEEEKTLNEYDAESGYPFDTDIVAIEYYCPHCKAHDYKAPDAQDISVYNLACETYLQEKDKLPIPQQAIPEGYNTNQIINHGYRYFKDLFNPRQLLCLGYLLEEINRMDDKNVQLWLQLAFSGMLEMNNMFCRYQQNAYKICNIFFNHAYVPIAMPVENCVWGAKLGTGTFIKTVKKILRGKKFNTCIYDLAVKKLSNGRYNSVQVMTDDKVIAYPIDDISKIDGTHPLLKCGDSRNLDFIPDGSVDLVLTDPPYGSNVMYSELIDFFHVWNHNSTLANEMGFIEPLSPKANEIIINSVIGKDFTYYQNGIQSVFEQCHKKLKNDGYLIFSFHDKSLKSWLSVLESIYSAGYNIVKAYPVQSETRTGAHTSNKNSIGIDIMLVSQKVDQGNIHLQLITNDFLDNVVNSARKHVISMLERLQKVEAEITIPDIQNIAIGEFFVQLKNYSDYDNLTKINIINVLSEFLDSIEILAGKFDVTQKRNGWWSELHKEK